MGRIQKVIQTRWLLAVVLLTGLAARLAMVRFGSNFDFESWRIVAGIMHHGGNVYAETRRYNYGPVWFWLLGGMNWLAGDDPRIFRYLIVGLLSAADVGIFWMVRRRYGMAAGMLFFLNPVSIIITGFHNQFDNLAICLGLMAVMLWGEQNEQPVTGRKWLGLLVLGVSLMTKHLLFIFPLWLAVKQRGWRQKLLLLAVPVGCFVLGFVPYWSVGHDGILVNVFDYHSTMNRLFYRFYLPECIQCLIDAQVVWYVILVLLAFYCRQRNGFESLLVYLGAVLAFSPSTVNEYLVIPIAFIAVCPNAFFYLYSTLCTVHLCVDQKNGLGLWPVNVYYINYAAIFVLCLGMFWHFWRRPVCEALGRGVREVIKRFCATRFYAGEK